MTAIGPAAAPAVPEVGRPVRALVVDRRFGPFFWGSLVSNTGTWLQSMSAVLLVFGITGSATAVGVVAVAQYSGYVLLAPVAGQLADRFDRRRLLLVTQSVGLLGAAGLVLAVSDGSYGILPIYVGVAVTGCAQALSVPLIHALVPTLVPAADLPGAVALQSLTYNVSRAVGPALGATALVAVGPVVTFGANAASYVAMLLGLMWTVPARRADPRRGRRESVLRYLRGHRAVAARLLVVGAVGFAVDAVNTLAPPVVARLGQGDESVGVLVSAFGIGGAVMLVLAVSVIRRIGDGPAAVIGLCVLAAALVVFGNVVSYRVVAPVLVLAGAGFVLGQTALTTSIQRAVPDAVRGRVAALWAVLFLGIRPFAAVVNGGLADLAGVGVAVLVPATLLVLGLITVRGRKT
ncbi:MAG: MFS transporter [Actinophytocola sp.]|uniref:MFS transporter n=1 Tax=Actinophytocola sp. TaxID=1872138 RepID=UPI001328AB8E|nr:MFS transporter [Actinophytocola sp.]MPZ82981.1 MFS transporter [Actinophytocola sp.]